MGANQSFFIDLCKLVIWRMGPGPTWVGPAPRCGHSGGRGSRPASTGRRPGRPNCFWFLFLAHRTLRTPGSGRSRYGLGRSGYGLEYGLGYELGRSRYGLGRNFSQPDRPQDDQDAAVAGLLWWAAVMQSRQGAAVVGGCGGRLWWAAAAGLLWRAAVVQSRQGAAVVGGCGGLLQPRCCRRLL